MNHAVYLLTWCREEESIPTALLTFNSLRTGFPDWPVHVYDNASIPVFRQKLRDCCHNCRANLTLLDKEVPHYHFLNQVVLTSPYHDIVFLDPDMLFWADARENGAGSLMAGRCIPEFEDVPGFITRERLHTSFLRFSDLPRLRQLLEPVVKRYWNFGGFQPFMYPEILESVGLRWIYQDTGATLWTLLKGLAPGDVRGFAEDELDRYDHIFCGSHLEFIATRHMNRDLHAELASVHKTALEEPERLKGLWRQQQEWFLTTCKQKVH